MKNIKIFLIFVLFFSPVFTFSKNWNALGILDGFPIKIENYSNKDAYILSSRTKNTCLFKTYNAGLTWDTVYISPDIFQEGEPFIVNANQCESPNPKYYFITYSDRNVMRKSLDSGKTFTKITINTSLADSLAPKNLEMYDENIGFINTTDSLYITEDGWNTWKALKNKYIKLTYNCEFIDKDNIKLWCYDYINSYFKFKIFNLKTLESNVIFEITDSSYIKGINIAGCDFVNDSIIFIACKKRNGVGDQSADIILKSTDSGKSWRIVHNMEKVSKFGLQELAFYDDKRGIAVGAYSKVLMTNDGGETWVYDEEASELFKNPIEGNKSGPAAMKVMWIGQYPYISTIRGFIYRYEGNFFDFPVPELVLDKPGFDSYDQCSESKRVVKNIIYLYFIKVKNANQYVIEVSKDTNFQEIVITDTITSITFSIENAELFDYGKKYFYRVKAKKDSITSDWSETNCFTTYLEDVETMSPVCEDTLSGSEVLLKWKKLNKEYKYEVNIYAGVFNPIYFHKPTLILKDTVEASEYLFKPQIDTVYTWYIRALNEASESEIRDQCYFFKDWVGNLSVENGKFDENHALIFPNPSSDKILLDLGGIEVVDLVVYDILGNEIMSIPNYSNKSEIDISTLSIGTYTIQVQTNTGSISQRLLVNR